MLTWCRRLIVPHLGSAARAALPFAILLGAKLLADQLMGSSATQESVLEQAARLLLALVIPLAALGIGFVSIPGALGVAALAGVISVFGEWSLAMDVGLASIAGIAMRAAIAPHAPDPSQPADAAGSDPKETH